MANYKTNKTVIWRTALVLIVAVMLLGQTAASAGGKNFSFADANSARLKDANFPGSGLTDFETGELFYKMLLAVFIVIVLGIAAIYFSKKLLPKFTQFPGKEIRVIETVHLGRQRALHLVKIGNRKILIGVTGESITKISDINETGTGEKKSTEER